MRAILGLFLIVATAGTLAQQQSKESKASLLPDANQRSSSEARSPETATLNAAAGLPDAPSYTSKKPSSNASTLESKRYLNFAMPNSVGDSSLVFVGSNSAVTGYHQQLDGSVSGSGTNCRHGSSDKTDGSGWITSVLSATSKGERYCTLGEGGFWKRGTYAVTRALAAHKYDGASSFNTSYLFASGIAPGFAAGYYTYQNYAGERLAARYASAIGRDAIKNMFREFLPDISTHMLHRHP
jgi:hypothetical protein